MTSAWRTAPALRRWLLLTASMTALVAASGLAYSSAKAASPAEFYAASQCAKADGALHVHGVRVYDASGKQFISYGVTLSDLQTAQWAKGLAHEKTSIKIAATDWCVNTIRLQIAQDVLVGADGKSFDKSFWDAITAEVTLAEKSYHLDVVLNDDTEGTNQDEPAPTAATVAFWRRMAAQYKNDPDVIFDLFNEPRAIHPTGCGNKTDWNLWQNGGVYYANKKTYLGEQQLVSSVRDLKADDDSKNLIWVENICGSFSGVLGHLLKGANIVYDIHHPTGTPHAPSTWNTDYGFLIEGNHVPVVDGEWTNYASSGPECWPNAPTSVPAYLAWMAQHGIGMSAWSLLPGVLITSASTYNPTVIMTSGKDKWRCANGLNQGAGALIMAWFKQQNEVHQAVNQAHGLCLEAWAPRDTNNGDKVQLNTCDGDENQFWSFAPDGAGPSYELVNEAHGLCLDAEADHDAANGDRVELWACNGGSNQRWKNAPGHIFENGAHGLCLDAESQHDGSAGDVVQLYACDGGINQVWRW